MKGRRRFLAGLVGAVTLPAAMPKIAQAQELRSIDSFVQAVTKGAPVRRGRVKIELPQLADNGNAVPVTVSVEGLLTATDYVKGIYLISNRNPVAEMASFHLGPRSGRARVVTRVRLAGSQTVTVIAALSDGTFWVDSAPVVVTLSACMDES